MKRRRFVQTVAAIPAVPAAAAQQGPGAPAEEAAQLEYAHPDDPADPTPRFFHPLQLGALRRLSDILAPSLGGAPGALEAEAAEFLDFLIGVSPADRQQLYRNGLDTLNAQAKKRYNRSFADLDAAQADALLAPLREPWTHDPPADPLARFLRAAKQDVRTATLNSKVHSTAAASGGRRFGVTGLYWFPID
jgi:hypothetical protein